MLLLEAPSCWYTTVALIWSAYQGIRGIVETRLNNSDKKWPTWQKLIVLDIHDFAFRFTCTLSGFISLLVSYRLVANISAPGDVSTGLAALLATAILIAVVGIGGQLHYLILLGKLPGSKGG